jgi:trichohyalin
MKDRLNDAVRARERMSEEQSRERIVRMERERQQEELQGKLQRQLNEQLVLKEQLEKEEKEKHHSLFLLQQQFDQEKNKWEQEKKQEKEKEKEAAALRLEESLQQLRVSFLDKCEKEKEQLRHTLIETLREKETDHERSITSSMAMFKQEIEELKMTATTAISSQRSAEEQMERQQELSKEKLQTAVRQMKEEHQSTLKKMEQRKEMEQEAMSVRHSHRVHSLEVDISKCKIETETATAILETARGTMRNELTKRLAMEKEKTLAAKNALVVLQKEQVKERAAHQVNTSTHDKWHEQEIQRMTEQNQQVVAQAIEEEKSKHISKGVRSIETMKDALEKQKLEMENKERATLQTILQEQQEKERIHAEAKARHAASIALLEQERNKERDQRNQLLSKLSQMQAEHSSQVKKLQLEIKHEQEEATEQQAKAMGNRLQQLRSAIEEDARTSLIKLQEMHDSAVKKLEHLIQNLSFKLQSAESTKIQLTNDLSTAQERCQYQEERIMLLEASLEEHSTRPIADVAEVRAAAEEEIKGQSTRLRAQKAHQEQYTREKEEWTKTRLVKQEQIMQHQASIQKLKLQHQDALKIALKKQQQQATSSKKIMQQQIEQQKVEFINLSKMLLKEKKHRDHERKRHAADLRVYKDEIKEEEAQHKIEIEKLSLLSIPKESIDIKIIKDKTMKKTRNRTINKEGNQSATQTRRLKSNNYKFGLQQSCVSSLKKKVAVEILIHNEQLSTKAATKSTAAESHPLNIYQLASSPLSTHRHSPRRRPPPRPHPPCSTVWNSDWYLSQPSTSQPIDELINKCF